MEFLKLCQYFNRLEEISSRLEMTDILAGMFKDLDDKEEIGLIIYLIQGRLVPAFEKIEFGMSEKLIGRTIAKIAAQDEKKVIKMNREIGDWGNTIEKLVSQKSAHLAVKKVHGFLYNIAVDSGEGAVAKKIDGLSALLKKTDATEAKYIMRIILGKLRLGVGDPTILDSLSSAYTGTKAIRKTLERAYNLCSDLGLVAKTLFAKGQDAIENFSVIVGRPIRMALAERLSSPEEIIEKIGKCAVEGKYDGFRCQVHKDNNIVKIYSRNLEDHSEMFPEIIEGVKTQIAQKRIILEGEAIAHDPETGEFLPFQVTVQRKRKYGIDEIRKLYPLQLLAFDLLYADDMDYTNKTYTERRARLKEIVHTGDKLKVADNLIIDKAEDLEKFFEQSIGAGLEGIVAKRLDSPYKAGARDFTWIKLKKSYQAKLSDTIDCVLVGYFAGRGMRARFGIGSLLAAVYDKEEDRFKTIAKIGSGLTEEEWVNLKHLLDKIRLNNKPNNLDSLLKVDAWVSPHYVVEVQADEITKSPVHTCGKIEEKAGYALRFPRMVSFVRKDKGPQEATSVEEIIQMYENQRIKG